jgi:hypothetical protein
MWCCSEMGGKAFALTRESLFFACAKKSNQKKAPPGDAPSTLRAAGPQAGPEFSEGTSMCPPRHFNNKLARIVRAAPVSSTGQALWVYPASLAAAKGGRSSNSKCRPQGPIPRSPFSIPGSS